MDVVKAICDPSGDQAGFESGPSCATSLRTEPSATDTIEMSAEPELAGLALIRWSKAMLVPSGDHAKLPTVNAPLVSCRGDRAARSTTNRWVIRKSCSTIWNSPYLLPRALLDAGFGLVAVEA